MITRTHTPTHTLSVFLSHNALKTRLTRFSLNYFFFSPLLLVTPETLPNHLFRQTNDQKWSKNLPKGEKKFSFFFNLFHIFPLQLRRKTKPFTFSALLSLEIEKPQRKTSRKKFFFILFFLLFCTLPLLVIGKIATYLFFRNSDLKYPKMPLSALKIHILQNTFFPP